MCGKLRVCLVFNLSQLVGGPSAIKKKKKPMAKVNSNSTFLLPGCVVSVIFGTKRCFSPNAEP